MHLEVDGETDMPLTYWIAPANRNDKVFFDVLYNELKDQFSKNISYKMSFLPALDTTLQAYSKDCAETMLKHSTRKRLHLLVILRK